MRSLPKGLLLVVLLLSGLALALALLLDRGKRLSPERLAQWWSRRLLALLNITLEVDGRATPGAPLIVANHVSWLDIHVIAALTPTRFISKSEVRDWPVVGPLAQAAGTFFLRRGRGGAAPVIEKLVPHLRNGGAVTLFPEGTTTDGSAVRPFHARLFAAAVDSGCAVQPVALYYRRNGKGEAIAPFIGDDDLLSHILRVLREPELRVDVRWCAPLAGGDRDALALAAESAIRGAIEDFTAAAGTPEKPGLEATPALSRA